MKKTTFWLPLSLIASLGFLAGSAAAYELKRPQERVLYQKAVALQQQGQWQKSRELLPRLENYPLLPYLEYEELNHRLSSQSPEAVKAFIEQYKGSPMANRLERNYLFTLAAQKRWQDFLNFYPEPPSSTALQCHHYFAKLKTGDSEAAFAGAEQLWVYGRSRPDACDPLFSAFMSSGKLTEELIWQRMALAFSERQYPLMVYLQKILPAESKGAGNLFLKTYSEPSALLNFGLYSEQAPRIDDIVTLGLVRLSGKNLADARRAWEHYSQWPSLPSEQQRTVELAMIRQSLLDRTPEDLQWADSRLEKWKEPEQMEWRIRIALRDLDWQEVRKWIYALPEDQREKDLWRYWLARAGEELGQTALANAGFSKLASERSFYGFLAADKLKLPYQLNEQPLEAISPRESLAQLPGFARVDELLELNEERKAKAEWMALLSGRSDEELLELGQLAMERNWHHFAVQSTIKAKAWDLLKMRFPQAEFDSFSHFAGERQLALSFLYAIARQESALNPFAKSPVGASGLMQLMPATAKATAKKIGFKYRSGDQLLDPQTNIMLGSAYIDQLLEEYDGNRILATAAYNAGPHRVKRWRDSRLPVDVWVETIPFRETRGYVKNVLSFNLIYDHFLGENEQLSLLAPKEQSFAY